MAKIRRVKRVIQPDVAPPDLTQTLQQINIPRGLDSKDRAIEGLGANIEFSAQTVGYAFARQQDRRSISEASTAFRDVPINELSKLNEAKKNPGDLATFQTRQTEAFDLRMKTIREGLSSERAKLRFDEKTLSTRTSMAKNVATWARGEEISQSRNNMNSELSNQVSAAAGDIGNLQSYRDESIRLINEAATKGFLIDGRGKRLDSSTVIRNTLRTIDLEVANSLIQDNPAVLVTMIDNGLLSGLTDDDKRVKTNQAISSGRNIQEKAELTIKDSYLSTRKELQDKITNKTATYQELEGHVRSLDIAVASGDETAVAQQAWLERARDKALKSEEDLLRESTQKKVRSIKATEKAKQITGTGGVSKPSVSERSNVLMDFINEFQGFDIVSTGAKVTENEDKFKLKDKDNPSVRMSDILDFWTNVSDAQDAQLLSEAEGNMFFKKLIPVMRSKIASKHFGEIARPWWRPDVVIGVTNKIKREKDKYSDAFSSVLSLLESVPNENTQVNQAKAIRFAFQLAEDKDINKIDNVNDRLEAVNQVAEQAIQMLNNENHPSARGLKTNVVIEFKGNESVSRIERDANGNRAIVTRDSKGKVVNVVEIK